MGLFNNIFSRHSDTAQISSNIKDVENARNYVSSMSDVFRSSTDQQRQAMKKMAHLSKTISKMEVDLRHMERIEASARVLTKEKAELERKLSQKSSWASEQETKLIALEGRHKSVQRDLETAKGDIAVLKDREISEGEKTAILTTEIANQKHLISTQKETVETLESALSGLQDDLSGQRGVLSDRDREISQLQKSCEDLTARLNQKTRDGDNALIELKELRIDFTELKSKYIEANSALEKSRYDMGSQKTVLEDTLKRREDENLTLKNRLDRYETEVSIKQDGLSQADIEIAELRRRLATASQRAEQAESRLKENASDIRRYTQDLTTARSDFERLNVKFTIALEDIEALRKINQGQKAKLERYAAIGGVTSGQVYMNSDSHKSLSDERALTGSTNVTSLQAIKK